MTGTARPRLGWLRRWVEPLLSAIATAAVIWCVHGVVVPAREALAGQARTAATSPALVGYPSHLVAPTRAVIR